MVQLFLFIVGILTLCSQNGTAAVGGNRHSNATNQLYRLSGLDIDDADESTIIDDSDNHRIVRWTIDENDGKVVAGDQGQGNRLNNSTDGLIGRDLDY